MNCCEDECLSMTVTGTLLYSTSLKIQQQANDRQRIRVNTRIWKKKKDRRLLLHLPLLSSDTVVPASFQFQLPAAQDDYNECKERQAAKFLWWSLSLANSSITILM